MLITFIAPEIVYQDFRDTVSAAVIVFTAMAITAALASSSKLSVKWVSVGTIVSLTVIISIAWQTTFGRFIQAEVNTSEVKLLYLGPFGGEFIVPSSSIDTVLFGGNGKTSYSCYIRIIEKSGATHRSATLAKHMDACKSIRSQILSSLSQVPISPTN